MILKNGKQTIQALMAGDWNGSPITQIGLGTSTAPVSENDTELTNTFFKEITSFNYVGDYIKFSILLGPDDPEMMINEIGLYNSNGTLCYRKLTTPVYKTAGVSYAITYSIRVQ